MHHLLAATIAGSGFALAGMLGLFGIRVSNLLRVGSVAIAAGILLAIAIADLVPESLDLTSSMRVAIAWSTGFLALFLIEALTKAHVHHHDPHDGHDHSHDDLGHHHAMVPFCLGLGLHNLADGLAIGASAELSTAAAAAVTLGVLVHQLPVGVSFAAVLHSMHASRRAVLRLAVLLGLLIPIGAGIVALLGALSDARLGVLVAGAAGALTYVATGHLLPEAQSEERQRTTALLFAATLLLSVLWFATIASD